MAPTPGSASPTSASPAGASPAGEQFGSFPAVVVQVTTASEGEARALSRAAVERRLAACAQVGGPVASTYWWDGDMVSASEWTCTFKTVPAQVAPLVDMLRARHSFDVPEIVVIPVVGGSQAYLRWVAEESTGR